MSHRVYAAIVNAVKSGALVEPFSKADMRAKCPGFAPGTYRAFLDKHAVGNRKTSELFQRVSPGRFKCLRPFRYGL